MTLGVDASFSRQSGAALSAAGVKSQVDRSDRTSTPNHATTNTRTPRVTVR